MGLILGFRSRPGWPLLALFTDKAAINLYRGTISTGHCRWNSAALLGPFAEASFPSQLRMRAPCETLSRTPVTRRVGTARPGPAFAFNGIFPTDLRGDARAEGGARSCLSGRHA